MTAFLGLLGNAATFRDPRRRLYFVVGAIAFCGLLLGWVAGFKIRATLPQGASFAYSVVTGLTLLGCILYQWMLFFARLQRQADASRRHYVAHRYVGSIAIVLFALHAGAFGYALVMVLALGFAIVAVTGLFNKEVVILRAPWLRTAWEIGHVGISGVLLPLVTLHVWAALAFK